jgi:putative ABC transport system permease protein
MTVLRDLRHAATALLRAPGFTLIAVITLGLGIGANTSAFSILNEILLTPLPYDDVAGLDRIYRATPQNPRGGVSTADYLDLKSELTGYGEVATYAYTDMSLSAPGEPTQMATGARISANLFPLLGVEPLMGRGFREDEMIRGNHRVLLISHRLWKTRFAGATDIIGRAVRVDGEVHEIVGVMPDTINDWRHLGPVDFFRPLGLSDREIADRSTAWMRIIGRRSSSVTHEQGGIVIAAFGRRLSAAYPAAHAGTTWQTLPISKAMVPATAPPIFKLLVGLSAFVLLIACSNLANLLLARTMARAREFAVRAALGASRMGLLRPLFMESLLLALAGAICAMGVAKWNSIQLALSTAGGGGEGVVITIDWRVFLWAFGACLLTAIAFGAAPALFILRLDPNHSLRSGSRGNTGDRWQGRFRHVLIIGQFALAMVLLAGAGQFMRGLDALNTRHFGWEATDLVTGVTLLPSATYADSSDILEFHRLALQRLEEQPGVSSASIAWTMPFFALGAARKYQIEGRPAAEPGYEPGATLNGVSPHYFETVGTRLLSGRTFDERDGPAAPGVYIINEAMARGLFGDESPIGHRIAQVTEDSVKWGEIVGVAGNVETVSPDANYVPYQVYQPIAQEPRLFGEIAVRADGVAPAMLVDGIRTALESLEPDLSVRTLEPAEITIARVNSQLQLVGNMFAILAALGLGLASLGIYGVITRTTAQRTGEFGIRLALGAVSADITRLVLRAGARLAITGSIIGLVGAFGISRLLANVFSNLEFNSMPVMAGVTLLLISSALLACYIPARSASRRSPAETLRG